jgi:hypothetical protein
MRKALRSAQPRVHVVKTVVAAAALIVVILARSSPAVLELRGTRCCDDRDIARCVVMPPETLGNPCKCFNGPSKTLNDGYVCL